MCKTVTNQVRWFSPAKRRLNPARLAPHPPYTPMRTKQSHSNASPRQKPQEHREATTLKAKSKGNESHRSHGSNENPWKPKL